MLTGKPGHLATVYDKAQIRKTLIDALLYLGLFLIFYIAFIKFEPYYLADAEKYGPIDSRVSDCEFFDAGYVYDAKHKLYKIPGYFQLFLPLDLAFPIVYTVMFLTILSVFKKKPFYKIARYFIVTGMAFDYLENLTFSLYLKSSIELSSFVAFFTTVKTFLFVINGLGFLFGFIIVSLVAFKKQKTQPKQLPGST